ncbi:MAG TPA: phage holin family protein [Polyangiaceae bacterium]|nr:phage holin family protein [Polyangiaceae bacterium]
MAPSPLAQALGRLVFSALGVFLVSKVLPGLRVRSLGAAFVFAFAVGLIDVLTWRLLGGAFAPWGRGASVFASWAVTTLAFWVAGRVIKGVEVEGCLTALLAAFGVALVSGVLAEAWHRVATGQPLLPRPLY